MSSIDLSFIPITAVDVPVRFSIKLVDRTYVFTVRYNTAGGFYTADLATVSPAETLCYGEVIRYGKPLFEQFSDERYPIPVIIPLTKDGADIAEITPDNFGSTVKLWLLERPS